MCGLLESESTHAPYLIYFMHRTLIHIRIVVYIHVTACTYTSCTYTYSIHIIYTVFLPFYYDDIALVLVPFVSVTIDSYDIVTVLV